jgi:hypothetical protein
LATKTKTKNSIVACLGCRTKSYQPKSFLVDQFHHPSHPTHPEAKNEHVIFVLKSLKHQPLASAMRF